MKGSIAGVILAGGSNRRFGGLIKAKIPVGGIPIIERILAEIDGIFSEIIIVTNNPEEFSGYTGCRLIRDEFPKVGPLGGIHAALKSANSDAVFVFAGDMPLVDKELVTRQMHEFSNNNYVILVPRIGTFIEPLHSIYSRELTGMLENYLSEKKNSAVYEFLSFAGAAYFEPGETDGIRNAFINVNTPDDAILVEKILGHRRGLLS